MVHEVHSLYAASISDLKKNPMLTMQNGHGEPIAILNHNQPVFYCVPADYYEKLLELIDDQNLVEIIKSRMGEEEIAVTLDDL